ncbi:chemotaxis protein CheW [Terrarubrum flagellatum]|uniref:chemotaxis protein CheW n=1 Tax=Terrirubrum flagellatum TaxID=2895980 RepID=UPI003144E9B6
MTSHKGIEIDAALAGLVRHMHSIEGYREVLAGLRIGWDTLTLLGQLSSGAAEMSKTREAFERLTGDLLNQLGIETRKKAFAALRTKAQNGIDVLTRNLFERTADIGFLAADTEVREFLEAAEEDANRTALEARFREYVAKYSVYSDIVLMDKASRIRARLRPHNAEETRHPLVNEALTTSAAYVEYFGEADFLAAGNHLLYAFRVASRSGRPLGALALVFRLDDEMDGVFSKLIPADDWTVLACVGSDSRVIASSCPIQLPVGFALPPAICRANGELARFGGRQYLAVACRSVGYQGYMGPGWTGLALAPIEHAFNEDAGAAATLDAELLGDILRHSKLFPDALRAVPQQAAQIQRNLSRSVWNGSVRLAETTEANADFSKALLWETSSAGARTQAIFDQAIADLQQTVIAALLQNVRARAAFAIDVMDRNLYERANDCRWWALDATFRRALADPARERSAASAEVLSTINGLYTVYTNLLLFDATGKITAVSQPSETHHVGRIIDAGWASRTLALHSTQDYVVSDFEPSDLYGGGATYIYAAAVQHPAKAQRVGGIAIVFDSTPQFSAMLEEALPRNEAGAPLPGSVALFVDRAGEVIASTDARYPIGSTAELGVDFSQLRSGESVSRIATLDGQHCAIGAVMSGGYREYKLSDGYVCDVVSVCVVPLSVAAQAKASRSVSLASRTNATRPRGVGVETIEVATFHARGHWLGVPARDVIEAVDATGVTAAGQTGSGPLVGYKLHRQAPIPVLDLAHAIGVSQQRHDEDEPQIVIVKTNDGPLGLLVDSLGDIPHIAPSEIAPLAWKNDVPATGVVRSQQRGGAETGLLLMLDVNRLCGEATARPVDLQAAE